MTNRPFASRTCAVIDVPGSDGSLFPLRADIDRVFAGNGEIELAAIPPTICNAAPAELPTAEI